MSVPELDQASKTQSPKSYLYTSTVKSHLGEQLSLIISQLISHGKLPISALSSYTKLPIFNVKQALVSLVQLNIVTYFTDNNKKTTYYYFNESGVLKICYSGDIIMQINLIYNDESMTQIIQNFLNFGYLTFKDYISDKHAQQDGAFIKLIQDKWLIPIDKLHFQSKFDLYNELFKSQLLKFNKENKSTSESKKIAEVKQITNQLFLELLKPDVKYTKIIDGEPKIIPDIPFTFNLNRFLQRKRSILLQDLCKHKLGPLSLKLYEIILNRFEKSSLDVINEMLEILKFSNNIMTTSTGLDPLVVKTLQEGLDSKNMKLTMFNANDLLKEINHINKKLDNKIIDFRNSIIQPSSLNRDDDSGKPVKKKIKLEITENLDNLDDDDFHTQHQDDDASIVMQHLQILNHSKFLKEASPGKFYVPIMEMVQMLKDETMMQLIKLIFGQDALRIVNCIKDLKLIDEKMLNNILLMKDATIRSNLNKLVMHNILQLQEIPKTNDRLLIRTVFAFKYNNEQLSQYLIKSLYFNLGEILTNIDILKNDNKILLDKCNRDDVKGKELEVLIETELIELNKIYEQELGHLTKYQRILSLIDVFEL